MRTFKVITVLFLISTISYGQIDLTAGMGISFVNSSSLQDYINSNFPSNEELSSFNTLLDLYLECDYMISDNYQVGFEYNYSLFSYTTSFGGIGQYDLNYVNHKPSALIYYILQGYGYKLKFGGGLGPRFIDLDEKIGLSENYKSTGFGIVLKAQGLTALSSDFFANIGVNLSFDAVGEPANNGKKIYDYTINKNVNVNSFSVGVNIGITYSF